MLHHPLPRLDHDHEIREKLLTFCRLSAGESWRDRHAGHRIGCLDATVQSDVTKLCGKQKAVLAIHDLPYNFIAFEQRKTDGFIEWCRQVVAQTERVMSANSSLYLWIGADQNAGFAPLPELMLMMRETVFQARSFITLRNQRGYGTQQNWMSVRQELLYYTKGKPAFAPQYTDIPKAVKGYYKDIAGERIENTARGKGETLRAGNVWIDVQQVFYRMEENVNGCYAQKPLKAITRIIEASSQPGDVVLDFFSHSGTTLLACEMTGRKCLTIDNDPLFAEVTRRRLEHYRRAGKLGWQNSNPFARELGQLA